MKNLPDERFAVLSAPRFKMTLTAAAPSPHQGSGLCSRPDLYNWTGFYIGGHVGGAFNGSNGFGGTSDKSDGRFLGGVQIGCYLPDSLRTVFSIEGQYSWVGSNNTNVAFVPAGVTYNLNQKEPRLGHRSHRLHLGSGTALREGQLRLLRLQRSLVDHRWRRSGGFRSWHQA